MKVRIKARYWPNDLREFCGLPKVSPYQEQRTEPPGGGVEVDVPDDLDQFLTTLEPIGRFDWNRLADGKWELFFHNDYD